MNVGPKKASDGLKMDRMDLMDKVGGRVIEEKCLFISNNQRVWHSLFMNKRIIWLAGLAVILQTGCLTSQDSFFAPEEIRKDDRLDGVFLNGQGKPFLVVTKDADVAGKYSVALFSDKEGCSFDFSATLFQVGTNRFLDLLPRPQGCDHVAGSGPGLVEILQAVTLQPLHMAVRVQPGTNSLEFAVVTQEGLQHAAERYPELFVQSEFPRMKPNTKNQREFLLKAGGDTNIFKVETVTRRND